MLKRVSQEDYHRRVHTFYNDLAKQIGPLERVHYCCLVYLQGGHLDSGTFVATMSSLFNKTNILEWLQHEDDLKFLAKNITQRNYEAIKRWQGVSDDDELPAA